VELLESMVEARASVFAAEGAFAGHARDVNVVLGDVGGGFGFGVGCFEDLVEQYGDEVGALVDRLAPRGGFVLVGGEPVREVADPLEAKLWFVAEELLVGAPVVVVEVVGEGPGVEVALIGELDNVERDTGGGRALGQGFVTT